MKKKKLIVCIVLCIILVLCGCRQNDNPPVDETEVAEKFVEASEKISTEELVAQDENVMTYDSTVFEGILAGVTKETLVAIVVEDFDNNGLAEAFAITADPDMYARFLVDPESTEGCMSSSFWYITANECTNIYFEDKDAFLTLEYGTLGAGTKYVMVEDWGSAHYSYDSLYTVENNTYKLMFTLPSIEVNKDGTISSYSCMYTDEGYVEDEKIYTYANGELKEVGE